MLHDDDVDDDEVDQMTGRLELRSTSRFVRSTVPLKEEEEEEVGPMVVVGSSRPRKTPQRSGLELQFTKK